jgi:hypothetical protein
VDSREHPIRRSATLPLRGAERRRGGLRHARVGAGGGEVTGGEVPGGSERAGADAFGEADGFRGRFDSQLLVEDVAAGLELGQGGRPVVPGGQEPHQQPVGLLRQGVK